jgi:hypothetical protein
MTTATEGAAVPAKKPPYDDALLGYPADPSGEEAKAGEKVAALTSRLDAVESLLACYRVGKRPSERLLAKLDRTSERLDELGLGR